MEWHGDKITNDMRMKITEGLDTAAQTSVNRIKRSFATGLGGPKNKKGSTVPPNPPAVRTGTLRRSITKDLAVPRHGGFFVRVGTNTKYAPIQEYGGTIPARTVRVKSAKSLRWIGKDGKPRFAKSVRIPATRIPARPFMRPERERLTAGSLKRDLSRALGKMFS